ncbi:Zfp352 [Phodopus roborovskii]|uniref:Zfp352 protein n=1 Tax=Phodopus roborovskii TaxID=109678 RepID=A0AAU9ZDH2_PHORO|nr:Zfp352 [Phodopus roborovskii]
MSTQPGRIEETEEPQQVISEPCKDQGESPGDCQPAPCTPSAAPVETSQLESVQRQVMPIRNQTVMTSGSCSTPRRAFTQNSNTYSRKVMDFHFREPSETVALHQHVVSAEETKSPAGSQLMELNTQEPSTSDFQGRAVPDSKETVHKEGPQVKSLSGNEIVVTHSTAVCERQRINLGENQDVLSGGQPASLEGGHVRSFNDHKTCDEDYVVTSVIDQTIKAEDQETPVTGDQTFHCNQTSTRMGEKFPCEGQMAAPFYSQAHHPSHVITSSSDHTCCGYKRILNHDLNFRNYLQTIGAYQIFCKHQETDSSSAQINHYGQLVSSYPQKVCTSQGTEPSVEECVRPRVICFSGGDSSLHSCCPLRPRQPSKSVSVCASGQGQLLQDDLYLETKSGDIQEKTHNRRKPYFCTYGYFKKSFSKFHHLRKHFRTHTGKKLYECDWPRCRWKFPRLETLNRHKEKHLRLHPYRCNRCRQSFSRYDHFKEHLEKHFEA